MVGHATAVVYEMLPSKHLPQLDLSRSLGGEFVSCLRFARCHSNRIVVTPADSTEPVRRLDPLEFERGFYARVTLIAYNVGHLLAAVACVAPGAVGPALAVMGLVLSLPGSLCAVALLRFDAMKLQVRAYEFWFYLLVSTVSTVLLAKGFGDLRACVAVVIWFGNFHTIAIDANTKLVSHLVQASVATFAISLLVLLAMETSYIPAWKTQVIQSHVANGSPDFNTNNLISNGLTSMMIILCRNVYRRHYELIEAKKINCPMMRCLNLRCQISMQATDARLRGQRDALTTTERYYFTGPQYTFSSTATYPNAQMHNVRIFDLFNADTTLYPVQLKPLHWKTWERYAFAALGCSGLALTASVFGIYPSPHTQPIAVVGLCCTMAFMIVVLGLYQLKACMSIVMSFDFLFLSAQFSLGLWSAGMLFKWDIRTVALASMWLWLHWVITIDALLPLMKEKIGFNTKFLLVPVLLLFLAAQVSLILEMVWLDHWGIRDRVLIRLAGRFQMTLLPFLVSRVVMSSLWSLRVLWRIINSDNDDTVIALGRLAFMHLVLPGENAHNDMFAQPDQAQSKASSAAARTPTAQPAEPAVPFAPTHDSST